MKQKPPPTLLSPHATFAAARLLARRKRPYFTDALLSLMPHEMPGLGTLAVTKDFVLMWDPAQVAEWGVEFTASVLLHEIEHPLRNHHDRMARIGAVGPVANLATDAEINDDLVAGQLPLPDAPVTPKSLGLPDGRLAEEYYQLLRQQEPPPPPPQPKGGKDKPDDEGDKQDSPPDSGKGKSDDKGDDKSDSEGNGESGDADGDGNSDSEAKPGDAPSKGKQSKPGCPGSGKCGSAAGHAHEAESQLPPELGRSKADIERVRRQTAERIVQAASNGKGDVPGGLVRWANEQLQPPKVPWQSKLARTARRAVTFKAGATDYRRDRVARRQAAYGVLPGTPLLPALRAPVPKVSVVIDTSGSMGDAELNRALSETAAVLKVAQRVEFLASDAKVHEVRSVQNIRDVRKLMVGGGGTDFRPVFTALDKAKHRPDVVVFITDGIGPAPVEPPKNMTTIWLLTGKHRRKPYVGDYGGDDVTWGEVIEVDD